MAPSNSLRQSTISRAESIALLHLLHSVPTLPSSNSPDRLKFRQGYSLPFTKERHLVSILAFLAKTNNDSDYIPAICVNEDPKSSSINVLLAVNKGKPGDGKGVLQELKQGFERINAILSRVSDRKRNPNIGHGVEDDIFTEIITMCSRRILCRLRFVPNVRKKSKQPFREVLQEAMRSLEQLGKKKLGKLFQIKTLFTKGAKEVMKLADACAKHQGPVQLRALIEGVYRLRRIKELEALLSAIPDRDMDPSARRSLFNIISKVARYREAARFLYRTAKKFPLVRQMKIVLVNLAEKAFHKVPMDNYTPKLASTVARISPAGKKQNVGYICRLLNTTEQQADTQFADQTRRTMTNAKIHAEIQLLFYCELNPSRLPPRVICSSKDACFLCNAFILMNGNMHMPRYHGRLYPGWRLPFFPELNDVEKRFNSVLDNQVRNSLKTLLSRRRKTVYPDPNESALLTLPSSASTLLSSLLSEVIGKRVEAAQTQPTYEATAEIRSLIAPSTQTPPSQLGSILTTSSATETEASVGRVKEDVRDSTSDDTASEPARSASPSPQKEIHDDNPDLVQGVMLSQRIAIGNKSPLYAAGLLEAQVEYPVEKERMLSNLISRGVSYGIEWVAVEEANRLQKHRRASLIDAEALQGELSYELDDENCLFIMARGAVIRISFMGVT